MCALTERLRILETMDGFFDGHGLGDRHKDRDPIRYVDLGEQQQKQKQKQQQRYDEIDRNDVERSHLIENNYIDGFPLEPHSWTEQGRAKDRCLEQFAAAKEDVFLVVLALLDAGDTENHIYIFHFFF